MATQGKAASSDFVANLGKIYGFYTGGFFGFVIILAILEQLGVPNRIIGYLFVFLTLAVYAVIGVITRTMQVSEYYVAGRRVPAFYNGMATGADWMSGASFVGMAGTLFLLGYDGLSFVLVWTGGYVLVAIFVAPYLRKFGAYTVPDFLAERFGGSTARFCGVLVLLACSFTYVTAQIYATGIIASRFLASALSTADGLLLAIANALSHDVYYRTLDPNAPTARRLVVARVILIIVALIAAFTASTRPADILSMVAWAFSLSAAGNFPALVLGIWWKRANSYGAVAGIIAGFGVRLYYLVGTRYFAPGYYEMWSFLSNATDAQIATFNELKAACASGTAEACANFDKHAQSIANWWGVRNISAALFGLPVGFLVMIVVSLLTPAPSVQMQSMVDNIRRPSGGTILTEKTA